MMPPWTHRAASRNVNENGHIALSAAMRALTPDRLKYSGIRGKGSKGGKFRDLHRAGRVYLHANRSWAFFMTHLP